MPPARFALIILEMRCCFLPTLAWTSILLFYAGTDHHTSFPPQDGVLYIFFFPTWADLELDPSDLSLLHSWDNRNAPLYWLRWGLENYLPRLTLNQNPPDLSLLSS
jgi:hypothetical protein